MSVGSLYQYFPNKHAILYRLQVDEWARTGAMIEAILSDEERSPADRLRDTTRAFFLSECEEAPYRRALDAAAPVWQDTPQTTVGRERSRRVVAAFLAAAAPYASAAQRDFASEILFLTITSVGKQVSERLGPGVATTGEGEARSGVEALADAIAAMLTNYLAELGRPQGTMPTWASD